jgi:hypothetical protein
MMVANCAPKGVPVFVDQNARVLFELAGKTLAKTRLCDTNQRSKWRLVLSLSERTVR